MGQRSRRRATPLQPHPAARGNRLVRWFVPPLAVFLLAVGLNHAVAARVPKLDPWSADIWVHWDAGHYLSIAEHGYELFPCAERGLRFREGSYCGNTGWFPGYPWLIRLAAASGAPVKRVAHVLSSVAFLGTLLVLWIGFLRAEWRARPLLCLLLAGVFPGQVYFHAVFPVSLAALAVSASLLLISRENWWAAGLCGGAAALSYASGFLIAGALLAGVLLTARERPWSVTVRLALASGIAALGLAVVLLVHQVQFGVWNAFLRTQAKYGHGGAGFWSLFAERHARALGLETAPLQSLLVLVLVLLGAGALLVDWVRKRPPPVADIYVLIYLITLWLFPYFTTYPGHSFYRGEALLVPMVVLLRRLPVFILAPLVAAATAIAWLMAQLFFRNTLV